ncbi:Cytochrome P450 52A13 [Cytospora mali]|uniref:Cytochrome P450 52A13 n=1 Tax=Cytospora mali TaxID=578113 RepID=A0A194ULQ4_CYTMA|nr:Cytochrome P450 52A13 [Valsa mali var. pyri (nom. inval.)]
MLDCFEHAQLIIRRVAHRAYSKGIMALYQDFDRNGALVSLFLVGLSILVLQRVRYRLKLRNLAKINNCKPIVRWPLRDPFLGLDYWWALNQAAKRKRLLNWLREQYDKYGSTYYTRLHITDVITTCDPDNLKAMHTTRYEDFAVDQRRELAFLPLLGRHSVLLSNGHEWERKRAMLRPSFSREQYTNTALYEKHVSRLIGAIKESPDFKVNLARLFLCLTVDITSDIMFDKSIELLVDDKHNLLDNMTNSAEGGHASWLLVWLTKFVHQPVYHNSVAEVRKFMQEYLIEDAINFRKSLQPGQSSSPKTSTSKDPKASSRAIYLEAVASSTDDPKVMLDELTTILFAGRDTTAALMTNLFFLFSRHPEIWAKVREEVAILGGEKPTHEQLKSLHYLQSCLKEALRLHPVIPINTRMAIRDTVLPKGGGPDGQSPIVVPKGTNVAFHVTALHRRSELWGDDAEEFKPERWTTLQVGWIYQPFGMGPRNCPGQHLSLAEAAYTTCRLAQEFGQMNALEDGPWEELISLTCTSASGAQVEMVPV